MRLYPHFKITDEDFPRILATRVIDHHDRAEYFGPFLPETGMRYLIDVVNRIFRLRTCDLELDGSDDVPCTQFYRRRCLAPCVSSLCSEDEYRSRVALARAFLAGDTTTIDDHWKARIDLAAAEFDFETAAVLRDEWLELKRLMSDSGGWNFRLEDVIDTFETEIYRGDVNVFLVSMRGRRTIGRRAFVFTGTEERDIVLTKLLSEFYQVHLPAEIRVDGDFEGREDVVARLTARFGQTAQIVVPEARRILAARALGRTKYEHEFKLISRRKPWPLMADRIRKDFGLARDPQRIECFDVAHISGTLFVAARSVFVDGRFVGRDYAFEFSEQTSELSALSAFVAASVSSATSLVLVDGGKSQVAATLRALGDIAVPVVGAVKPAGKHAEIREFIRADGVRVEFNGEDAAHRLLQTLRDDAHELANDAHRQRRDMAHFYEPAALLPSLDEASRRKLLAEAGSLRGLRLLDSENAAKIVGIEKALNFRRDLERLAEDAVSRYEPRVVPLWYVDENGDASDLRPLAHFRPSSIRSNE